MIVQNAWHRRMARPPTTKQIDALYAGARVDGTGSAGAIAAARDEVSALIGEEDQILADLRGRLGT